METKLTILAQNESKNESAFDWDERSEEILRNWNNWWTEYWLSPFIAQEEFEYKGFWRFISKT